MLTSEQRKRFYLCAENTTDEIKFSQHRYSLALRYDSQIYANKLILDIGTGLGIGANHMYELSGKTSKVIGLDYHQYTIDKAVTLHPNVEFHQGLAFSTQYINNFFDLITSVEMIEHMDAEEVDKTLKEVYRILKPNGLFFISTPERRYFRHEYPSGSHYKEYDFDELKKMVTSFGFEFVNGNKHEDNHDISMTLLFKK